MDDPAQHAGKPIDDGRKPRGIDEVEVGVDLQLRRCGLEILQFKHVKIIANISSNVKRFLTTDNHHTHPKFTPFPDPFLQAPHDHQANRWPPEVHPVRSTRAAPLSLGSRRETGTVRDSKAMRLSLLEILEATGGGEVGGTQVGETFSTYHTDSREVQPGGLFFALRGAEMDGHDFVADAVKRGAAAVIVQRRTEIPPGVVEILVPDTWAALFSLAAHALRRVQPLVVGITGSNGKTSTKEMVAAILSRHFNVLRTQGNLNTETGVPLTILSLEPHHSALVLEMGLQRAGDIARLASLARPVIGIVTNVGVVHMEFFRSREELAREKGELVAALPEAGLAVLNADNEFFPLLVQMTSARVASFGQEHGDYRVEGYEPAGGGGASFSIGGVQVRLVLDGRHQALNAAAALAACEFAGVPLAAGAESLAGVRVDHRLQEITSPAGFAVVDDAYNASPESMLAAFDTVAEGPRPGRLLAVLGEMRELGPLSEEAHRHIGKRAAEVFDAVAVVDGERARPMAEAAGAEVVLDRAAAAAWVRANAQPGDRVLVKASHGVRLDELVRELTTA